MEKTFKFDTSIEELNPQVGLKMNRSVIRQLLINRQINFLILSFIGFLFAYKYGQRVSIIWTVLYIPFIALIYYYIFHIQDIAIDEKIWKHIILFINLAVIVGSYLAFRSIDVHDLHVDRWSVITHYWDTYYQGLNPYSSISHMGNHYGAFPFYFITMLPFYWLHEIGWTSVFSLFAFQIFIYWKFQDTHSTLLAIILSMACICFPYELISRSTIFANSVLVIISIQLFVTSWSSKQSMRLPMVSFLVGLLICTRPIFGLAFLIGGVHVMKRNSNWNKLILAVAMSSLGLILPFLHVYILFPESIMEYNPISYMTSHFVPTWLYGIYLMSAVCLGYVVRNIHEVFAACGIFLFFVVICYSTLYIINKGWVSAIFSHYIDLSYLFMAVPFLIYIIIARPDLIHSKSSKKDLPMVSR